MRRARCFCKSASSRRCTSPWSRSARGSAEHQGGPRRSPQAPPHMITLARENGLRLAAAARILSPTGGNRRSIPTSATTPLSKICRLVARANLIFGLHVHIGVEDRETAIHIMNDARYFLPHILALSTNSPFWLGMETGLKSYRCKVFDKFPRTNIPDYFRQLGRIRELRQPADQDELHRQREENLVGHPPASVLQHARVPRLRHADAPTRRSRSPR